MNVINDGNYVASETIPQTLEIWMDVFLVIIAEGR